MRIRMNAVICGDNMDVMREMDSKSIDLIYLDPPFNSNRDYGFFDDRWGRQSGEIESETHNEVIGGNVHIHNWLASCLKKSDTMYMAYMSRRLLELKRLLKDTGSIYLHCDPTMSHYLKSVMDSIFGKKNFRNEIIWKRRHEIHNLPQRNMGRIHDVILWYGDPEKSVYHRQYLPYRKEYIDSHYLKKDTRGEYRLCSLTNESGGNKVYEFRGVSRAWKWSREKMQKAWEDGILVQAKPGSAFRYKSYLKDGKGVPLQDIWDDIMPVKTEYPTEKPMKLLERIIKCSSVKGDIVFDPFCGSGTALAAAKKLNRKYVGCDMNPESVRQVEKRLGQIKTDVLEFQECMEN